MSNTNSKANGSKAENLATATIGAPDGGARERPEKTQVLDVTLQESVLAVVAFDQDVGAKIAPLLRAEMFDGALRDVAAPVLRHWRRYNKPPGEAHIADIVLPRTGSEEGKAGLRRVLRQLAATAMTVNARYVLDRLGEWVRERALTAAVDAAADCLLAGEEEGRAAEVETILRRALDAPVPAVTPRTTGLGLREFLARPRPEIEPVMSPWLDKGTVHFIHGREGTMKTRLALHIAESLADCRPCLDGRWIPDLPTRTLFVDGELSSSVMADRLRRLPIRQHQNLHILSKLEALADGDPIPSLYTPEGRARIDREVEKARARVLILDSIFALFGTQPIEKEPEKWEQVKAWLDIHRAARRSVIIIHHEPKSGGSMFGSVIKSVFADGSIALKKTDAASDDPEEEAIEIAFNKTREFGGSEARPFVAFFRVFEEGGYSWRTEDKPDDGERHRAADEKRSLILARLAEGVPVGDIAREAACTEAYVYKVRREAERSESTN